MKIFFSILFFFFKLPCLSKSGNRNHLPVSTTRCRRAFKYTYNQPESQYPQDYVINQNYPNTFNPSTVITFNLPIQSRVILKVYDILGKEVSTLIDSDLSAGEHFAVFNAANLSSGIYFYQFISGSVNEVKKMMLLK